MNKHTADSSLLTRLFFRLLPVQILIVAMGSVNSIVDGVTAARFISPASVGVIGLHYTLVRVMEAVSAVLIGGSAVLCGRYLGSGKIDKTCDVFSLNITLSLIAGALLTGVSLFMPSGLAGLLGADESLRHDLAVYITGYAFGILPQILAGQLSAFLQLERQGKRCYIGVSAMIITNAGLDILLVGILHKGVMGLALATAIGNWIYFLILVQYYFSGKAQLKYRPVSPYWGELPSMLIIGLPGAVLVFCLAARNLVINHTLLTYAGNDGLSAMSSFNMLCGILIAIAIGAGAVVRMLTSVFVGEEDQQSVLFLFSVVIRRVFPLSLLIGAAVLVLAPVLAGMFYADHSSQVYALTRSVFALYSICVPMVLLCQVFTNYFQAIGRVTFVNILSVFDGFLAMVIPSLLLAPSMGAKGVWLSLPIGIFATLLLSPLYSILCRKRLPANVSEWLLLDKVFPQDNQSARFSASLHEKTEVAAVAEKLQTFCEDHSVEPKQASHCGLCFEEMAWNIFQHGFQADRKRHTVNLCMLVKDADVMLRIKDDCIPFDPVEFVQMTSEERSPFRNIGIRLVYALASEINYQNLMGLNVLTIRMDRAQEASGEHATP